LFFVLFLLNLPLSLLHFLSLYLCFLSCGLKYLGKGYFYSYFCNFTFCLWFCILIWKPLGQRLEAKAKIKNTSKGYFLIFSLILQNFCCFPFALWPFSITETETFSFSYARSQVIDQRRGYCKHLVFLFV
jgi:hypothetical protein